VALESAEAVNAVVLLLDALRESKELVVATGPREAWNVDSALFSCPSAEIWLVSDCVSLLMIASCGALVAATSCETSELTLMTDPPAAPALLLLATETTGLVDMRGYRP
jgi:hypothetical protein